MTAFLSGISVVCFVASYAVALACEASRLVFRSGVRGAVMVAFAAPASSPTRCSSGGGR